MFRHHSWEKVTGHVLGLHGVGHGAIHPEEYEVQLHPEGKEPYRAQVRVTPHDLFSGSGKYKDLQAAGKGDVRTFLVDARSGEVRFDMSDKRNCRTAFVDEEAAWDEENPEPAGPGEEVTGPPWIVPAKCPSCGAAVDQATATIAEDPRCAFCKAPLPAQPRSQY